VESRRLPLSWILGATAIALVVAGIVVLTFGGGDGASDAAGDQGGQLQLTPQGEIPESVQGVALGSLDGGEDQTLGDLLDGRPVVINFFAQWCQPCLEEMPAFEQVHQELGDQVQFVGLDEPPDTPDEALAIVDRTGVTYPVYADPSGAALTFFEGLAMPTTVFLDAEGQIVEVYSRALSADDLRSRISDHFGVAAGA
jgi:cytochrome c biogenesis protein CcmG/thiol:disulfide interchange protein DsbE